MADFKKAHAITAEHEGGYCNDKDDRGGETYKGVARKIWPDWKGWEIVDKLKIPTETNLLSSQNEKVDPRDMNRVLASSDELQKLVETFYKYNFWDRIMLDKCPNQDIANELYDTAVNQGVRTASKYLQRCLNLLNRDQRDWDDIKVDGAVGNKTVKVLNTCISKGKRWVSGLLKCLNGEQYYRYRLLAIVSSKQEKFMHGWLKRVTFKLTN